LTRQTSTLDAFLEFDPRTAFSGHGPIKRQEEWLRGAFEAFANRRSNLQIGIGVAFRYGRSTTVCTPNFADTVVAAWRATMPLSNLMHDSAIDMSAPPSGRRPRTSQNALGGPRRRREARADVAGRDVRTAPSGPQAASGG
jgi:hypothetical protein